VAVLVRIRLKTALLEKSPPGRWPWDTVMSKVGEEEAAGSTTKRLPSISFFQTKPTIVCSEANQRSFKKPDNWIAVYTGTLYGRGTASLKQTNKRFVSLT